MDDRVIAVQGERRSYIAAAFGSQISLRQRRRIYLGRRRSGQGKDERPASRSIGLNLSSKPVIGPIASDRLRQHGALDVLGLTLIRLRINDSPMH